MLNKTQMRIASESGRSMPKRVHLGIRVIEAAVVPPSKERVYLYDLKIRGLALQIMAGGSRVFYLIYRFNGRKRRYRLGDWPGVSVDQARDLAQRALVKIAGGVDPMDERQVIRSGMTLGALWEHWKVNHADARLTATTRRTDGSRYDTTLKAWSGRQLSSIQRGDVVALHSKLGEDHGHTTGNRAVQLLRRLYRYAARIGNDLPDPTRGVMLFRESARERFVTGEELPRLFAALEADEPMFRDFFKLALLTGARRSNLQAMKWQDIDLDAATWTVAANEAKAHRQIVIPLCPKAVEILKERLKSRGGDAPWVFPSPRRGATGHLVEVKVSWARILERSKIDGLTVHDLRRTLGSWQAGLGSSMAIIGKSLGHSSTRSTEIYSRLAMHPVRQSVNAAASAMLAAAGVAPLPNRQPIR